MSAARVILLLLCAVGALADAEVPVPGVPVREVFVGPGTSRHRRAAASPPYPFAPAGRPRSLAPNGLQVVGGSGAACEQFPHQASMQVVLPDRLGLETRAQHLCGGSLVAARWVLTAAHCVHGLPANTKRVEVLLGATFLSGASKKCGCYPECAPSQRIIVSRMLAHGQYDYSSNGGVGPNDIALLKLSREAVLSAAVQLAKLPVVDAVPSGTATLSGWGSVSTDGDNPSYPDQLQWTDIPILDYYECSDIVSRVATGTSNPLAHSNLCAMDPSQSKRSSCSGDSGGPLVQYRSLEQDVKEATVVGVVSWGLADCGSVLFPSVFTRVSAFVWWIRAVEQIY